MDSDRQEWEGTVATDVNTVRVPAGFLFIRGVQVFNASNSTEQGTWLERRDQTFLSVICRKINRVLKDLLHQELM